MTTSIKAKQKELDKRKLNKNKLFWCYAYNHVSYCPRNHNFDIKLNFRIILISISCIQNPTRTSMATSILARLNFIKTESQTNKHKTNVTKLHLIIKFFENILNICFVFKYIINSYVDKPQNDLITSIWDETIFNLIIQLK